MNNDDRIKYAQDDFAEIANSIADFERSVELIASDQRLSDTHRAEKLRELEAEHASRVEQLRAEAREWLDDAEAAIEAEYQAAKRAGQPATVQDWQEAAARSQFVREDVAAMSPGDIVAAYRWSLANDKVGAFLIARHGLVHLARLADTDGQAPEAIRAESVQAAMALDELAELVDGGATERRRDALNRVAMLRTRFEQPLTPAERREFGARLGVDPQHVKPS